MMERNREGGRNGQGLEEKFRALRCILGGLENLVVLFSGGVDSTLLAPAARRALGDRAVALTLRSPLEDPAEAGTAVEAACRIGIRHVVLQSGDLEVPQIAGNHPDRCYACRKHRDAKAWEWARRNGFRCVADGLNRTDLGEDRPGRKASDEDGILHPLLDAGLSREEIRELSRVEGLEGWERAGSPCLATRFPFGTGLSAEALSRVARAEAALRGLGFSTVRVRSLPGPVAVVEVPDPGEAAARGPEILRLLQEAGFSGVLVDLEGYVRGRMSRPIPPAAP